MNIWCGKDYCNMYVITLNVFSKSNYNYNNVIYFKNLKIHIYQC